MIEHDISRCYPKFVRKKNYIVIAIILLAGFVAILILPVSNFFLKREMIEITGGIPEFKKVSTIMQNKCVDCHTPEMMSPPVYINLPLAGKLITEDIKHAQREIIFSKEHLSGHKPFAKVELAKIQTVVENNEMPILPYRLLHWDAALTNEDKEAFLAWIQAQAADDDRAR